MPRDKAIQAGAKPVIRLLTMCVAAAAVMGCTHARERTPAPEVATERLDRGFELLVDEHGLATVGAAIIRDGAVSWSGVYGEQSPGVAAGPDTMFNVASIAKTVTAETVMRMVAAGDLSLDEPMSDHWVDPDLADDPRHRMLTPRLALTHRTGLPNWRYMDPEFRLRFAAEPGTRFGYSGEGFEYLARFVEKKSGQRFDALAAALVYEPLGIENMALGPRPWVVERIALPVDETGQRHRPFCTGPGDSYCNEMGAWTAADELATTVDDYARFMIGVMNGEGISDALQAQRVSVLSSTADDPVLSCKLPAPQCPRAQGYGLGWEIFQYEDATIVSHGGGDWSERAMAYFDPATRNGVVLFINGPGSTGVEALIEGLLLLDEDSRIAAMYRGWVDAYEASAEAPTD